MCEALFLYVKKKEWNKNVSMQNSNTIFTSLNCPKHSLSYKKHVNKHVTKSQQSPKHFRRHDGEHFPAATTADFLCLHPVPIAENGTLGSQNWAINYFVTSETSLSIDRLRKWWARHLALTRSEIWFCDNSRNLCLEAGPEPSTKVWNFFIFKCLWSLFFSVWCGTD